MIKLSQIINMLVVGNPAHAAGTAKMFGVTINPVSGNVTNWDAGNDITLGLAKGSLGGQFRAEKVWNAVWNDYADFQQLCDRLEFGRAYYDTYDGAKICNTRCQLGAIGIASDTFAHAVGSGAHPGREVPIAVGGWVLAFVDKEYPSGTPLTNDASGGLTEMTLEEKRDFPERLLGIYKRPEPRDAFGTDNHKISVNGRHWVKVK